MNLHKALTHPARVFALHVIDELGAASPVLVTERSKGTDNELSLNVVAYHFRVLAKMEVVELADEVARRGATEHVYRINPTSPVPDLLRVTELMESGHRLADSESEPISLRAGVAAYKPDSGETPPIV